MTEEQIPMTFVESEGSDVAVSTANVNGVEEEFEEILDHRYKDEGMLQFLVKWVRFRKPTW